MGGGHPRHGVAVVARRAAASSTSASSSPRSAATCSSPTSSRSTIAQSGNDVVGVIREAAVALSTGRRDRRGSVRAPVAVRRRRQGDLVPPHRRLVRPGARATACSFTPMSAVSIPILPSADFDVTATFWSSFGFVERGRWANEYLILGQADLGIELHFWIDPAVDRWTNDVGCYVRFGNPGRGPRVSRTMGRGHGARAGVVQRSGRRTVRGRSSSTSSTSTATSCDWVAFPTDDRRRAGQARR